MRTGNAVFHAGDMTELGLEGLKAKQQTTWASGDYGAVATYLHPLAEQLVQTADLSSGWRVLDVASGTGNVAIAAARCGCRVTSSDFVPSLLDRGRERAAAERLVLDFDLADAENLPYPDASFDAVVSVVGAMFAPDQERVAAELTRVCRPGGTDRDGELDAGRLRRADVPHRGPAGSAAARHPRPGRVGQRGAGP